MPQASSTRNQKATYPNRGPAFPRQYPRAVSPRAENAARTATLPTRSLRWALAWAPASCREATAALLSLAHPNLLSHSAPEGEQPPHSLRELAERGQAATAPIVAEVLSAWGEHPRLLPVMEALCSAWHILHCAAQCERDYARHARFTLPLDWLHQAGVRLSMLEHTPHQQTMQDMRIRALDHADKLLRTACSLPAMVGRRRLRWHVAFLVALAEGFSHHMRTTPASTRLPQDAWKKAALSATKAALSRE